MKRVIIVGGGYSIKEGIEKGLWNKIRKEEIWSLNYSYKAMPYLPDRELFVDVAFFSNNKNELLELANKGVILISQKNNMYDDYPIIQYEAARDNFDLINGGIFKGSLGLTGTFALSLAVRELYGVIYLLGYDFGTPNLSNRKTHFYQDDISVVSGGVGKPEIYLQDNNKPKKHIEDYKVFLNSYSKIYNVSLISNIPYFEKISYDEFFKLIK